MPPPEPITEADHCPESGCRPDPDARLGHAWHTLHGHRVCRRCGYAAWAEGARRPCRGAAREGRDAA